MSETVLGRLAQAIDGAATNDGNVSEAPVAVLWPDKAGEWATSIEKLRAHRRVLTLASYQPDDQRGPAYWVRCVLAGTLDVDGPGGLPIVYLPGVSRDDLRAVTPEDTMLLPLDLVS